MMAAETSPNSTPSSKTGGEDPLNSDPPPSMGVVPIENSANASTLTSGLSTSSAEIRNFLVRNVRGEHLAAGILGGVVSTIVCHPLDLIKIRFQVNEGHGLANVKRPSYHGIVDAFKSIVRSDGAAGLYAGAGPNILGAGASWGLYFFFYNAAKNILREDSSRALTWTEHTLCACQSGVMTLAITNPIWVTKTRLCLQYERMRLKRMGVPPPTGDVVESYKGMTDALVKISRAEGLRGLYKGFVPGLFGVSHGVIQFVSYEEMKKLYNRRRNAEHDAKLGNSEYLAFAALSKCVAAFSTYPYQVLRTRLQDQHRHYSGLAEVVKLLWRYEGFGGFYKGLLPSLLRVVPATMITFLTYENVSRFLLKR